jgi:hypothetical protein
MCVCLSSSYHAHQRVLSRTCPLLVLCLSCLVFFLMSELSPSSAVTLESLAAMVAQLQQRIVGIQGQQIRRPDPEFVLINDLQPSAPGQPQHLLSAIASAISSGGKAAKRFSSTRDLNVALGDQFTALVRSSATIPMLAAWNRYSLFVLSIESQYGLDCAQDYHWEMSRLIDAGEHSLLNHGHFNGEVFARYVTMSTAATNRFSSGQPADREVQYCANHGECYHSTAECKKLRIPTSSTAAVPSTTTAPRQE